MEKFLLIDDCNGAIGILDSCLANSIKSAQNVFDSRGWVIGEVLSEADYIAERQQSQMEVSLELGG